MENMTVSNNNSKGFHSKRILVVDDEEGIRDILKIYLESDGHNVFTAKNGLEALKILDKQNVDLILLDLMMPVMNGWEFSEALSKTIHANIPKIIITAYPDRLGDVVNQGVALKPFDMNQMQEQIKNVCERLN